MSGMQSSGTHTYYWSNGYGGAWGSAANWFDATAGTVAAVAPGSGASVGINGGVNETFINIVGGGAAAQLAISNEVLLWGSDAVAGSVALAGAADLELDGGASLSAVALALANGASLEVGGGSTATVSGAATLAAGFLVATNGGKVQLSSLIANSVNNGFVTVGGTVAVDGNSSIEIGTTGAVALGALTIDRGFSAAVSGVIDGNVVVNGMLGVQAHGTLAIDLADPFGNPQGISGSGTLGLSENSLLTLGIADSAAIRFGGPAGTLALDVLPSGTISGFALGDVIEIVGHGSALATGVNYSQTGSNVATLTLSKGGVSVGTLALAGDYTGSLFHLAVDPYGDALISLQTIGSAAAQPSLIVGSAGYDTLNATANNQTLTPLGGNDLLGAGSFTGIDFKDTSADLTGATITAFGTSSMIDLTDMNVATVSVGYISGVGGLGTLSVADGTHAASIGLMGNALPPGYFTAGSDGAAGTSVQFTAVNTDAYLFGSTVGGFATAAKWQDVTSGGPAVLAPSYGNAVTIAGGAAMSSDVTGTGFAASLATSGNVLLWGSLAIGTKVSGVSGNLSQSGMLVLDGAANLSLAGTAAIGGLVEVGGASRLTAAGLVFSANSGSLLAINGGAVQAAAVLPVASYSGGAQYDTSVIGVDGASSIEFGTLGTVAKGALTIDSGVAVDLAGTIDGNVVVNGTLIIAGTLAIAPFGSAPGSIIGAGTIALTWGDMLTLSGADSASILFSQASSGAAASSAETLVLSAIMPTGTISGFAAGDVITVARAVTGVSYSQSGGSGRLTLLNGASVVGTLNLAGVYVPGQFQVQQAASGLSSSIIYTAAPSMVTGNQISGNGDSYSWNNTAGGVWSNSGNWTDTTVGATLSTAPGNGNAVFINDATGIDAAQVISGNGSAASLSISGAANTVLTGTLSVAVQFSVASFGAGSGDVGLSNGATLMAGSLNVTSPLTLSGGSVLTVLGSGGGSFVSGSLGVFGGSAVTVIGGSSVVTGTIAVDAASSFEFGGVGGAAAGAVTIDAGQAPTLQGVATIAGRLVVNGSLLVYSGTIGGFAGSVGSISGGGTITIGALGPSGLLTLNASDSAAIAFQGYFIGGVAYASETLVLNGPLPTGLISGFVAGDSIIVGRTVTGVAYTQMSPGQGTLTLTNGATTVGALTLSGNYAANLFQLDVAAATGLATISVQSAISGAGSAFADNGSHGYGWAGGSGGSWNSGGNWIDTTAGVTPGTMPGALDPVSIAGSMVAGQYTSIGGNGSGASLTISGNVLLTGLISVGGQVQVVAGSGTSGALVLDNGAGLTAGGGATVTGRLQVEGGSSATIAGNATLLGGSLLALGGSTLQAGGLIGNGGGDVIVVDANSSLRIGAPTTAYAGTLTLSPSATAVFSGSIYGSVVANGAFWVNAGGALMIDMAGTAKSDPFEANPTVSGSGSFFLTEGSTLGLGVSDSVAIQFAGPNATLLLAALPTASISGFVAGDTIQVDQTVTSLVFRQVTGSSATLTLNNGFNYVGTLKLAGNYSAGNNAFHLDSAANGATAVITLQSLQIAPMQPTLIQGTVGSDLLTATANGQILTGLGGGDTMSGGGFGGIVFKDVTASLGGSTFTGFATSDIVDFTDLRAAAAVVSYGNGALSVSDGVHSATLGLGFGSAPPTGSFHIASDGAGGTSLTWH
ncbi:beta strand repeat-containing protein [Rhodopila sp.]|uniref:beta strand repeat-containing protein n=1 Tax=Rhodopila sp. TaxID=2480087 RepID=UPI003D09CEF0